MTVAFAKSGSAPPTRTADPYRELSVIDERAPRFNQATVGILAALAVVAGWWGLYALLAVQLSLGLALGRRWCLPCVFYFEVVQPRLGEGHLEDSRPPRFANQIGAVFLWLATAASALHVHVLGNVLGGTVAVLALLAATTGLCVGCIMYRMGAGLRGIRSLRVHAIDLVELGAPEGHGAVVQFTHPLCSDCQTLFLELEARGKAPILVDVSKRPDLASRYGVAVVPLAFELDSSGRVLRKLSA